MRRGRISKVVATAVAAALALAACTGTPPGPNQSATASATATGGNVTVLESAPFTSFNDASVTGKTPTNTRISWATHTGFNTVDDALKIVKNEDFGKY